MWVMLLEKAVAKLLGGYQFLIGGSPTRGMAILTGAVTSTIDTSSFDSNDKRTAFWKELLQLRKNNVLLGCSFSDAEGRPYMGLQSNHAYGLLDVREVNNLQMLLLRNPWGEGEWTGRFSDSSPEWTNDLKAKLSLVVANDGCFWMCYEDFLAAFTRVFIGEISNKDPLTVVGEWNAQSCGGCSNTPAWRSNPQYLVDVKRPANYAIVIEQDTKSTQKLRHIGFEIFEWSDTGKCLVLPSKTTQCAFTNSAQNTLRIELKAGRYCVIPSTFDAGVLGRFSISLYGAGSITALEEARYRCDVQSEWGSNTSGGCTNHPTWKNNPKFVLTSKPNAKVTIVLVQAPKPNPYAIAVYAYNDASLSSTIEGDFVFMRGMESSRTIPLASGSCILMPCTYEAGLRGAFSITVYSNEPIHLQPQ
jgi:hypothetical protein